MTHNYDTSKLRGRIIEKFGTQNTFAVKVEKSKSFVSQYMNGKKDLPQDIIEKWTEVLDLDISDIPAYFFTKKVHETEQGD